MERRSLGHGWEHFICATVLTQTSFTSSTCPSSLASAPFQAPSVRPSLSFYLPLSLQPRPVLVTHLARPSTPPLLPNFIVLLLSARVFSSTFVTSAHPHRHPHFPSPAEPSSMRKHVALISIKYKSQGKVATKSVSLKASRCLAFY